MAANTLQVIKNTLVMLAPVYTKNIEDNDNPIREAKTQKVVCADETDILFILALM